MSQSGHRDARVVAGDQREAGDAGEHVDSTPSAPRTPSAGPSMRRKGTDLLQGHGKDEVAGLQPLAVRQRDGHAVLPDGDGRRPARAAGWQALRPGARETR